MHALATWLFHSILRWGGPGLLLLGILDSSFLFAPWGNDVLLVAMTARRPTLASALYYAAMSTAGSVLGCLLIDLTVRPLGEGGLEKHLPARRLKSVKTKVRANAAKTLAIASLAPPPFPFTAFVIGTAALQYPRGRLLLVVGITRLVRFMAVGLLAIRFGDQVLKWADNPVVQGFLIGLIILCTVGSIISVAGWVRRSKSSRLVAR
jgi:membrane protein YqaA with SNARE-associated domain